MISSHRHLPLHHSLKDTLLIGYNVTNTDRALIKLLAIGNKTTTTSLHSLTRLSLVSSALYKTDFPPIALDRELVDVEKQSDCQGHHDGYHGDGCPGDLPGPLGLAATDVLVHIVPRVQILALGVPTWGSWEGVSHVNTAQ